MTLIGMLHHRKDPRTVIKAYAYAAIARAEGAELVYFSPGQVNLEDKTVNGYIYENGDWVQTVVRWPDVIYNTGSPEKLSKQYDIIRVMKQSIPFTTHSIGNKMRVYKRIEEAGKFSQYLIPSQVVRHLKSFFDQLNMYQKIVFKPVNGRKGQGILLIERSQDRYVVQNQDKREYISTAGLRELIGAKLREGAHMVQPYIHCKTKAGNAYDFRLHVQKDGNGEWVITTTYPRIAPAGSIIANINNGGATNYLEPFLLQEFGERYYDIKRYLEQFSLMMARHLDQIQMEKFNERIDELGMDVALDEFGKLWIFEINWRPGCPPAFYLELDVVKNLIRYCIYLANQAKEIREQIRQ
ncbi:YheC/YheD family endospore coat-associated protein [Brevibacillus dissolubilis]|uniref:YheC/YheD family endospore coat-associated protein n=1 Tax=Brevibacillus dissolubilis TaxID=1844116 RepID=UPI00210023CB|nr:YheC/YheD family protein [Brevibacillus dissolubilis]